MLDKKYLSIAGGLFLTAFLLVIVVFTSQTTTKPGNITRVTPRASSGTGTVKAVFSPSSNNLISVGATDIPVSVRLDPQGTTKTVNGVQFKITYSYTGATPNLEVLDRDAVLAGVQIQNNLPGTGWEVQTADQNYVTVDIVSKLVTINFFAINGNGYILNGVTTFATLYLKANALTGGNVVFSFTPTLSKVYEKTTGMDILSSSLGTSVMAVTADTVAPTVIINSGPANGSVINTRAPSFVFSATDDRSFPAAPFAYALSGPTPTTKTAYGTVATANFSGLANGNYIFTAYAKDAAGNEGSVARSFTVDGTVPTVSINTGPAAGSLINATPVLFTFSGTDNRTGAANLLYSYSVTGQSATSYGLGTTASLSNLMEGPVTFSVTSKDEAGNISTAATRTFIYDRTAPSVSIASGPTGVVNSNQATFNYSGTDTRTGAVLSYATKLDSGALSAYSNNTSVTYSGLTNGSHTFTVQARDNAGNVGMAVVRTFTVDTVAPTATITSGPTGSYISNSATFTWTGTDTRTGSVLTSSYRFDTGATLGTWSAYGPATSQTYNDLTNGTSYTFNVRVKDDAGNVSSSQTRNFTVMVNSALGFKLRFEGITATSSLNCPARNVRVTLKNPGTTTVAFGPIFVPASADAAGIYSGNLTNITATNGTYDVYLKGPGHLASKFSATISTTTPVQDWTATVQKAGDVAGSLVPTNLDGPDNLIDLSDWQKIFNSISLTAVVNPATNLLDLNCDNRVDVADLQLIYNNVSLEYGPGGEE